ncbi:MAG: peptidase M48 [Alphaproteobacteria bacterium]|nr:MAG: peptidase M48 [Alphaproteobacteria bacterium]
MAPTFRHRILNLAQSALLIGAMAVLAWAIVATIAGPDLTLAIVAGSILGLLFMPALPKGLLLSAYGARELGAEEFPDGVSILHALGERAGLPRPPALYYIPSELPNAFAMGTPKDSVVCVTDGLLRLLNRRELAGVLAHEVSHIANRDLWIMGLADAMSRAVSVASWIGQFVLFVNLPLLLAGAAHVPWHIPLLLIFSPTIMALMQLALSRTREYDADRGAVALTGDPEGLASALLKLEQRTGRFWEEIFLPGRRIPEPSLLRTHPPTQERVRRLRELAADAQRTPPPEGPLSLPSLPKVPPPRFGWLGVYR